MEEFAHKSLDRVAGLVVSSRVVELLYEDLPDCLFGVVLGDKLLASFRAVGASLGKLILLEDTLEVDVVVHPIGDINADSRRRVQQLVRFLNLLVALPLVLCLNLPGRGGSQAPRLPDAFLFFIVGQLLALILIELSLELGSILNLLNLSVLPAPMSQTVVNMHGVDTATLLDYHASE